MKKFFYCFILIILFNSLALQAQDIPPVYSQFYMNPAVFNPAFAGSDGYTSLYLVHRRQWLGMEDAPVSSTLNLHAPLSRNTAAGVLINHEQAGILRTSTLEGQFAYILPLGEQHDFRMGLGAGVSRLSMNLSEASDAQRAFLEDRPVSALHFRTKFGINYHYKALNIGISSNSLFQNSPLSGGEKEFGLDPLQDVVINAIYYANLVPDQLQLEPYMIAHRFGNEQRLEGGLLCYFKNIAWAGASYRNEYGFTALLGLSLRNAYKIAYAYELGNTGAFGYRMPSHEIQLAIQLGKERTYTKEIIRKPRFEM